MLSHVARRLTGAVGLQRFEWACVSRALAGRSSLPVVHSAWRDGDAPEDFGLADGIASNYATTDRTLTVAFQGKTRRAQQQFPSPEELYLSGTLPRTTKAVDGLWWLIPIEGGLVGWRVGPGVGVEVFA